MKLVVMYTLSHDYGLVIFLNAERHGVLRRLSVKMVRRARALIGLLAGKGILGG
ncbi:hypothetical protein [Alkalicaulis satelles]|uniref:hypothetical protein n=1 Tax=Alkalicaulis satelles TaxID=2609175 RepID=UPI0018EB23F8|nr:hypothetical protein [Alkalicaulis satelles]